MLYLAISVNLLLWDWKMWAITKADWKKLQTFHTKSIIKILGISILEVRDLHIINESVLTVGDSIEGEKKLHRFNILV